MVAGVLIYLWCLKRGVHASERPLGLMCGAAYSEKDGWVLAALDEGRRGSALMGLIDERGGLPAVSASLRLLLITWNEKYTLPDV